MEAPKIKSRIRAWAILGLSLFAIWGFGVYTGPWLYDIIPYMREIVTVIDEQNINASAYFYTEIEASYEGERYLREALSREVPDEAGLTWPFVSAIVICFLLLALGYRYLPND